MRKQTWMTNSADADDPWQTERRSSDWMVGDGFPEGSDGTQLALLPVEGSAAGCGRPDPIVASLAMNSPIAALSWRRLTVGNA